MDSKAYIKIIVLLVTLFASTIAEDPEPPESTFMDPKIIEERRKDFKGFSFNMVLVGEEKYVLTEQYLKQGSLYYNFKPRPGDVYLSYFPEAGTLWFTEVVWLLQNNLNFATVQLIPMYERVTWLEQSLISNKEINQLPADLVPSPGIFQTNLPFSLIPQITNNANKIIYFARNPKDTIVAFYNNVKNPKTYNFIRDIDRYWDYFGNDLVIFGPYWSTIKEGFALRSNERVLFLYSEEDPLLLIKKISKFLDKSYNDEQLKKLADFMEKRAKIEKETWKGVFSNDLNKKINKWIEKNIGDLEFPNIDLYS